MSAIDDYLDGLAPEQKAALARVRDIVAELVPDAEEGKSYGMPAFIYAGRPLLGFRAAQKHLSIFPFSPAAIEAVSDRLDGFDLAKERAASPRTIPFRNGPGRRDPPSRARDQKPVAVSWRCQLSCSASPMMMPSGPRRKQSR
jgi:uncharacterized protein YdhG (YjbR/CyaY superfamily)